MAAVNAYKRAASKREESLTHIEDKLLNEGVERTTMTLSISVEDKKLLKQLAIQNGVTTSGLIHQWIRENSIKNN